MYASSAQSIWMSALASNYVCEFVRNISSTQNTGSNNSKTSISTNYQRMNILHPKYVDMRPVHL